MKTKNKLSANREGGSKESETYRTIATNSDRSGEYVEVDLDMRKILALVSKRSSKT